MKKSIAVYWIRRDFRLRDNPALCEAIAYAKEKNAKLLPLFIFEDYMRAGDPNAQFGYPQRVFLSKAVPAFLAQFPNAALVLGKAAKTILGLTKTYNVRVFVNEDVFADFYTQVEQIRKHGVEIEVYRDQLTVAKETVSGQGTTYSVFTPFKKAVWESFVNAEERRAPSLNDTTYLSAAEIKNIAGATKAAEENMWEQCSHERSIRIGRTTYNIDDLIPFTPDLSAWYQTEAQALEHFRYYLKHHLAKYKKDRDSLEKDLTSKMSLALTWGLVSARTLVALLRSHFNDTFRTPDSTRSSEGAMHYISELIWREFYKYLLFHQPELMHTEFQVKFRKTIAWVEPAVAKKRFIAWIKGETGYAVVDAAMMQLAHTGWMHNRARMIVASVLTKNLGVDWRWGQEYFRSMLIDLDESSNNGGWQWGASVGADPKPIRIFNPYLQEKNYDTSGAYRNRWLPEERNVFAFPVLVEHKDARKEALKRYGLTGARSVRPRDY